MLAQFALIVFAMLAVLTLVVDLGLVTLTRVQMQNVADAAALEGVRFRNTREDGYASDCVRRIAARDLVRMTFDDDGDIDAGDARQFGAGPVWDFLFEPESLITQPSGARSPRRMLIIWGSSSRWVVRSTLPNRVIRGSFSAVQWPPPSASDG